MNNEKLLSDAYIRKMYKFVSVPFILDSFLFQALNYGWIPRPSDPCIFSTNYQFIGTPIKKSHNELIKFAVKGAWDLEHVLFAYSYFYQWENTIRNLNDNFDAERCEYNHVFFQCEKQCVDILGIPDTRWIDNDDNSHIAVVWGGDTGLLILQQSFYMLYDFYYIMFWLGPISISDFNPTTPLVLWLEDYIESYNEQFPKLRKG